MFVDAAPHVYDNECDKTCNECGIIRTVADHIYDNDCDEYCNNCLADRIVSHQYDNACDNVCNLCGFVRIVSGHIYTDDSDITCNVCGYERDAIIHTHIYSNNCDTTCNVCGETRNVTHTVNYPCDNWCMICYTLIENPAPHTFTNACDKDCNICGVERYIEHIYDDNYDTTCNICGALREADHIHTYDNNCDTTCNICGEIRTIYHSYNYVCDETCSVCGTTLNAEPHYYTNNCDTDCNRCGKIRAFSDHIYTDFCDSDCNECGFYRVPPHNMNAFGECILCGLTTHYHEYDNQCDVNCNICGYIRDVIHNYLYDCSTNCDLCGFARQASHIDTDLDTYCDYCNEYRIISDEDNARIESFIAFFNTYLANAHHNKENILTTNTKFDEFTTSGSINYFALDRFDSITSYENIIEYVLKDGSSIYLVDTNIGKIMIAYHDGQYEVLEIQNHSHNHNELPLLTKDNVTISNGMIEISSDYMKSLFIAMNHSGLGQYNFNGISFSYADLIEMFDYTTFVTLVNYSNNQLLNYDIILTSGDSVFYEAHFDNTTTKTSVTEKYYINRTISTRFEYIKGNNMYATFDLIVTYLNNSIDNLHITTNITNNIANFVPTKEFNDVLNNAMNQANTNNTIASKYSDVFRCNDTCLLIAVYDQEYNLYVVLANNGFDEYIYIGAFENVPSDYDACNGIIDFDNFTITVIDHNKNEAIAANLQVKYAGSYIANTTETLVVVYDSNYDVFALFVNVDNVYLYYGFVETIPDNYDAIYGSVDTINKTITVN